MKNSFYLLKDKLIRLNIMDPSIIEEKVFRLLGCVFYGDPFHSAKEWSYENEIGKLWQRFGKLSYKYSKLLSRICNNWNIGYELHLEPEEFMKTKRYYVMVGMEVNNVEEIPLEMFVKVLPKTTYVIFTTKNEDRFKIGSYIYREWMPNHGYEQAYPYVVQCYNKQYKLEDPKSEIEWYIPVKKNKINIE